MLEETKYVEAKILKEYTLSEHFEEFEQDLLERCVDCGSSVFRVYNEKVKEGQYEQLVCAICNHRVGGWLNDYKIDENGIAGKICRKCGKELER